jgi:TetR/AcrR family transcriptional regulator, repressor for uid operon
VRKIDPAKHEERRQQILEAAGRCFTRDGFRGASMADICAEANMSSGHVYHYFASKEAIISAMIEGKLARAMTRFECMMRNPNLIDGFFAEIKRAKRGQADQSLMQDMLAEAGRNPVIADILRAHTLGVRSMLATFIRKAQEKGQVDPGLDADTAAAVLLAVFDGAKAMTTRDRELNDAQSREYIKTLFTRFLRPPE